MGILQSTKRLLKPVLSSLAEMECRVSRAWVASAHNRLMAAQWHIEPSPEFFDHQIDLYCQWGKTRNSMWLERGVFGSLALKGGRVLELACGDGFNTRNFYSLRSGQVIACDFDHSAIKTAKEKNKAPNVEYVLSDIRVDMPRGSFENIVWDAAIEHFTPNEIEQILLDIKQRLTPDGVLSGYTIVEDSSGVKAIHQHEYEFKSKEDLRRFFTPHFRNVTVFETVYPDRHNLYFWASDVGVPFGKDWSCAALSDS